MTLFLHLIALLAWCCLAVTLPHTRAHACLTRAPTISFQTARTRIHFQVSILFPRTGCAAVDERRNGQLRW